MKRSPMKRGTKRMKRSRFVRFRSPFVWRPKPKKLSQFGEQSERCRQSVCCACGALPPCDPHHVIPRSRGGLDEHTVPLCRIHHQMLHTIGTATFERKYAINLIAIAADLNEVRHGAHG